MRIPRLNPLKSRRQVTSTFGGYDKRAVIEDGFWRNMENLTLDEYPTLKVRGKRGALTDNGNEINASGMAKIGNDLVYIEGTTIHVGDYSESWLKINPQQKHNIVVMGSYLIIFPEHLYFNTIESDTTLHTHEKGEIEAERFISETISFYPCDASGDTTATVKDYVRIENSAIAATDFSVGDGIQIRDMSGTEIDFPDGFVGYHVVSAIGTGFLVYKGETAQVSKHGEQLQVQLCREVPLLDVVFECGNRLWGARYGKDADGNFVNEIYASALGDFKNWRIYEGVISTNSYTSSVGPGGAFTGGCDFQGVPTFFKEDVMLRVYGSYPSQYQIQPTPCKGVMSGCEKSLAIVNNVLYYKSVEGVCAFDGSLPVEIGGAFGKTKYHGAVGGTFRRKYYISMADSNNVYHLFYYDATHGAWVREDSTKVLRFAEVGDELYMLVEGTTNCIRTENGTGVLLPDPVEWFCESGELGLTYQDGRYTYSDIDRKYVERLTIRARLGIGSYMQIEISYNDKPFRTISRIAGWNLDKFSLPVPIMRCDHFRLRLSGRGDAQIFSIAKTMQGGSDI